MNYLQYLLLGSTCNVTAASVNYLQYLLLGLPCNVTATPGDIVLPTHYESLYILSLSLNGILCPLHICILHCPKCILNFRYITRNEILHKIFCVVSRFPRYILYFISENQLTLGTVYNNACILSLLFKGLYCYLYITPIGTNYPCCSKGYFVTYIQRTVIHNILAAQVQLLR